MPKNARKIWNIFGDGNVVPLQASVRQSAHCSILIILWLCSDLFIDWHGKTTSVSAIWHALTITSWLLTGKIYDICVSCVYLFDFLNLILKSVVCMYLYQLCFVLCKRLQLLAIKNHFSTGHRDSIIMLHRFSDFENWSDRFENSVLLHNILPFYHICKRTFHWFQLVYCRTGSTTFVRQWCTWVAFQHIYKKKTM